MTKASSIKVWLFKSYLMMTVLGTLLFFVSIQLYLIITPNPLISLRISIYITILLFGVLLLLSLYFGVRSSYLLKGRLDDLSTFVSVLRSGNFSARVERDEEDEIGFLSEELNGLAFYIEEQVKSLQRLADERSELAEQAQQAAVMEERHRLARDLHDSVSQQLFALNMLSSAAIKTIDRDREKTAPIVKQVAEIAAKAQGEMRALLLHLRPIDLKGESLFEGLQQLIYELKEKTHITIEADLDGLVGLSKGTETHLFRIIQEGLSNILRHADASEVKLNTEKKERYLMIYIGDNGRGFSLEQEKMTSYGLQTMRERTEEIGGVFQIRSKEGEGTYINIRVPLQVREKGANEVG